MTNPERSPSAASDVAGGVHRSHKDVINRLKRADGHLQKIVSMLEGGRTCVEVAQQMHAVIRALESAKSVLIHDHIDHCIEQVTGPVPRHAQGSLDEFKEITKFL